MRRAELDPPSLLRLAPDEHVIWRGRGAVGAPWPRFRWLLPLPLACAAVWLLLVSLPDAWPPGALQALTPWVSLGLVITGLTTTVVALSKVVGPSYGLLAWLLLITPVFLVAWQQRPWTARGTPPGSSQLELDPVFASWALAVVGLPLAALVVDVLRRLNTTYVITGRRVAQVHVTPRPGVEWQRALGLGAHGDLRLERSWRAPDGYLAIGPPWDLRALHLRDDDPAAVLDLVRRERLTPPRDA
ncbi:MAG: hypothetical protein KIT58_05460 [Planctomycetota bacterium]|nr:hypothetical protein [Planctomycetota bacterium]